MTEKPLKTIAAKSTENVGRAVAVLGEKAWQPADAEIAEKWEQLSGAARELVDWSVVSGNSDRAPPTRDSVLRLLPTFSLNLLAREALTRRLKDAAEAAHIVGFAAQIDLYNAGQEAPTLPQQVEAFTDAWWGLPKFIQDFILLHVKEVDGKPDWCARAKYLAKPAHELDELKAVVKAFCRLPAQAEENARDGR